MWSYQRRGWSIDGFYRPSQIVGCNILERRAWFQWTRRETSLGAGSGLGAVLFDEPSQMILRAAKVETEQKKILKYTNAKGEVSWRGRKEKAGLYRRGSAPETNAALSVTPSPLLLSSLLHSSSFSSFALNAAASVTDSSPHKTWKVEFCRLTSPVALTV